MNMVPSKEWQNPNPTIYILKDMNPHLQRTVHTVMFCLPWTQSRNMKG